MKITKKRVLYPVTTRTSAHKCLAGQCPWSLGDERALNVIWNITQPLVDDPCKFVR